MESEKYVDPAHLYYAGKLTLAEAAQRDRELARVEKYSSASPELNTILRICSLIVFPFALVLSALANRDQRN
jgi:hypothetical protein